MIRKINLKMKTKLPSHSEFSQKNVPIANINHPHNQWSLRTTIGNRDSAPHQLCNKWIFPSGHRFLHSVESNTTPKVTLNVIRIGPALRRSPLPNPFLHNRNRNSNQPRIYPEEKPFFSSFSLQTLTEERVRLPQFEGKKPENRSFIPSHRVRRLQARSSLPRQSE